MNYINYTKPNYFLPSALLIVTSLTYINIAKYVSDDVSFFPVIFLLIAMPFAYIRLFWLKGKVHPITAISAFYLVILILILFEIAGEAGNTRFGLIYFLMESSVIYAVLVQNINRYKILHIYVKFHVIIICYGIVSEFIFRSFGYDYLMHQTLFISNRFEANINSGRGYISVYQEPTVLALNSSFLLVILQYIKKQSSCQSRLMEYLLIGFMIASMSITGLLLVGVYALLKIINSKRYLGVSFILIFALVMAGVYLLPLISIRFATIYQSLINGNFQDIADSSLNERFNAIYATLCVANNSFYGLSRESVQCFSDIAESFESTYAFVTGGVLRLLTSGGWPMVFIYILIVYRRYQVLKDVNQAYLLYLFLVTFVLFTPMSLSTFAVAFVILHMKLSR